MSDDFDDIPGAGDPADMTRIRCRCGIDPFAFFGAGASEAAKEYVVDVALAILKHGQSEST